MKIPKPWKRAQTGTWYVTLDGKQHNLGDDEARAKELYADLLAKRRGAVGPEENVRKLLDAYWSWCKINLAKTTCDVRKKRLKSFAKWVPADLSTSKLRPLHIQKWLDEEYPKANSTTRHTLISVIGAAINWACELGYIESNPIARMKKPRRQIRQEFVPIDRWQELFAAVQTQEAKDFLVMMLSSGIRVQEIKIIEARHREGDRLVYEISESKGRRRSRVVYLAADALEIVCRLSKENPSGPIFLTSAKTPWDKDSIGSMMRRVKKKLGMKKLAATALRHSFAHARLTAGQDSAVVAQLLGHVDTTMVTTRYGHLASAKKFLSDEANRVKIPQAQVAVDAVVGPQDSDTDQRQSA